MAKRAAGAGRPPGRETTRQDLAAMVVPLGRALVAAELPALRAHGLSMWAYAVLLGLADEPVRTQAALAQAIGADKTRIIGVLDDLEQRHLIQRRPDPADRRARLSPHPRRPTPPAHGPVGDSKGRRTVPGAAGSQRSSSVRQGPGDALQ
jgi:hypothetical protein